MRGMTPRKEAILSGSKTYFTGKKCKHGHLSERQVSDCRCIECKRNVTEKWRDKYPDKVRDYSAKYREENKEEVNQRNREWKEKNRDKHKEYMRHWRKENPDHNREWRAKNPEKSVVNVINYQARKENSEGRHTDSDIHELFFSQRGKCAACRCALKKQGKGRYHIDHIKPLSKGGTNWPENLQLLCPSCNLSKGAKCPFQWAKENGKLL